MREKTTFPPFSFFFSFLPIFSSFYPFTLFPSSILSMFSPLPFPFYTLLFSFLIQSPPLHIPTPTPQAMDAPQQLAQYYMMVTCKWRLAALLCFLKTHAHQKVMVFFSTCDSVDFHALLFRETEWPQDLDSAIEGGGKKLCRCITFYSYNNTFK